MMKIAFYITNENIKDVDCTNFERGNPGIGGSEYAMFALIKYLSENKSKQNDYFLLVNTRNKIPLELVSYEVRGLKEAVKKSIELDLDILVFKHSQNYIDNKDFNYLFDNTKLRLVVWAHNFITRKYLNYYAKHTFISRIVNVSNDQLNLYKDNIAYNKSTVIYNGININCVKRGDFKVRKKEVTYIGSIVPAKGFHILAKVWSKVIEKHPNAILNVIGSGNLYNRNQKLGKYGIAECSYEEQFMPYLINKKGDILDSVKFHGVLGVEKNIILEKTKVGVPNPGGLTETFGYTAIEMQAFSILVTTKKSVGYRETVFNKSNLYNDENELSYKINSLLSVENHNNSNEIEFIKNNFSFKIIGKKWEKLFDDIENGFLSSDIAFQPYTLEFKLIELNSKIKKIIPFGYELLPTIAFYKSLLSKIKR